MRVLILGASGRTGQPATAAALSRGHAVTALVRNPQSMSSSAHDRLTVVEGTPLRIADVRAAFDRTPEDPVTAVVVTLAVPRESDSPFAKPTDAPYLIRDAVRNALAVMRERGVRKLVVMSALGTGDSWTSMAWPLKLIFRYAAISCVLQDHNAVDELVRESEGVEWTLVRPPMLKDGEAKPVRELGETGTGIRMMDSVTRESVAEFLIDAVQGSTWDRKAVVITN